MVAVQGNGQKSVEQRIQLIADLNRYLPGQLTIDLYATKVSSRTKCPGIGYPVPALVLFCKLRSFRQLLEDYGFLLLLEREVYSQHRLVRLELYRNLTR